MNIIATTSGQWVISRVFWLEFSNEDLDQLNFVKLILIESKLVLMWFIFKSFYLKNYYEKMNITELIFIKIIFRYIIIKKYINFIL